MSDWQVGDLAKVVVAGTVRCGDAEHTGEEAAPVGFIGRIAEIHNTICEDGFCCGCLDLYFEDGSAAVELRCSKIKPDTEPCEEEFTVLIKRMKPAKVKS